MSQWTDDVSDDLQSTDVPAVQPLIEPRRRSILQPLLLLIPVIFASVSFLSGGSAMLTDFAFLLMTILCAVFLALELYHFSERLGVGGIVLYGGELVWFCYDYMGTWFLASIPHWEMPFTQRTVAKAAACCTLYVLCLSIGIRFRIGRRFTRWMTLLPEPPNVNVYFYVMLITQVIGLAPYSVFTQEPFYLALFHQIIGGRASGVGWTVGRTGNLNYNWGGYVAQIIQVGTGGALLAAFCLVFIRQSFLRKIVCFAVWLLWLLLAFGTGTRGEVVFQILPMLFFIFLRYHLIARRYLRRISLRAYIIVVIGMVSTVVMVQTQAYYRNAGFQEVRFSEVSLTKLQGNDMFTESLMGFSVIPETHDYFYDQFPGETIVLPLPNFLFWFVVAPMPRALWTTKPIDSSWAWYNSISLGGSGEAGLGMGGTTISQTIFGFWFFRFGVPGVIQGGLFLGWLMGRSERALLNHRGRPLTILLSLGVLTWLFRGFRDPSLSELDTLLVGLAGIVLVILLVRPFAAPSPVGEVAGDTDMSAA